MSSISFYDNSSIFVVANGRGGFVVDQTNIINSQSVTLSSIFQGGGRVNFFVENSREVYGFIR